MQIFTRSKRCFFVIIFSCFVSILYSQEKRIVTVGAFNHYPAIFKSQDSTIQGMYVDILTEIGQLENIEFKYVYGTWNECLERIKSGEIDIIPSIAFTRERAAFLHFMENSVLTVWGAVYVRNESKIHGITDFNGTKVGLMKGDFNAMYFKQLVSSFGVDYLIVEYDSFEDIFIALESNEVDLGVVNSLYGTAIHDKYNLRLSDIVFNPFDIYFASAIGKNEDVIKKMDYYIQKWKHEKLSVFNKARLKWSKGDIEKKDKEFPAWILPTLIIISCLLLLAFFIIMLFKIKVEKVAKQLLRNQKLVTQTETKFKNYVENSPEGIFVIDSKWNYIEVNNVYCNMLGYSESELLQMNLMEHFIVEHFKEDSKAIRKFKTEGKLDSDFLCKKKNGDTIWLNNQGVKLDENTYLGFSRSIQEQKNFSIELLKAKEKAEESDKLKTAFLHNMSHEIRTPMNAIMGFSDILPDYFDNKEALAKFADIISSRGKDLLSIIEDILHIAKIESGQLTTVLSTVKITKTISELQDFFVGYQKRIHKEHIQLEFSYLHTESDLDLSFDVGKFKQVVINLTSNALKFTQEGFVKVGIDVSNTDIVVYVKDTGLGIPKQNQSEIFNRFLQLNSNQDTTLMGTGIGLSIVKGIISHVGGKVWLDSIEGKGATFYFTFPYTKASASNNTVKSKTYLQNKTVSNKKILIIEDDETNIEYLKVIVSPIYPNLFIAKNGQQAISYIETNSFDLVLLDIKLPDISGIEVAKIIRNKQINIPIIAQTAFASMEDEKRILEVGCNEFISKPIPKDKLLFLLDRLL